MSKSPNKKGVDLKSKGIKKDEKPVSAKKAHEEIKNGDEVPAAPKDMWDYFALDTKY
jgi:hypothetical protein